MADTPLDPNSAEVARMVAEADRYLIRSLYHENGDLLVWWRPEGAGYTTVLEKAGRFTAEKAAFICDGENRNVAVRESDALAASVRVVLVPSGLGKNGGATDGR